ncbi:MAG: virulence RhuM family protein [Coriobacteriales bacterium]|jgi:hypothetical protein|nr:virulence RhuM family protein [Coriobacteriales bacterium]
MTNQRQAAIEQSMMSQDVVLFSSANGDVRIEVLYSGETLWLSQKRLAELFDVDRSVITKHLKNIFESGELQENQVCANFAHTAEDGKTYDTKFYNLDAIISVGYRVNSLRATAFRKWATGVLKEYMQKGFALDDERLAQGKTLLGKDYFRELLERIRSIRASERRIYQQITDIFQECSIDYDRNSPVTHEFFAMVQNKFHYAITGKTAPEIISTSADKNEPNMGLKTWKHSPDGRILRSDVTIAKNYLDGQQLRRLERAVSGFFDYIEDLVEDENTFTMQEFADSVNEFLEFRRFRILPDKGRISKQQADKIAVAEYDEFNKTQKILSDFDKRLQASENADAAE